MSRHDRMHLRCRLDKLVTADKYTDAAGRDRCVGSSALKGTQAYPLGFGAFHALSFHEWGVRGVSVQPVHHPMLEDGSPECLRDLEDPSFSWDSNVHSDYALVLSPSPARLRSRSR